MKCGSIRRTTKASSFLNSSIRTNQSTKGGIKNHCCLSLSSASSLFVSITICETSQSDNREIKKSGTPLQTMQNLLKQSDGRKKEDNNPKEEQSHSPTLPLCRLCAHTGDTANSKRKQTYFAWHTQSQTSISVSPQCATCRAGLVFITG